jgi:hypothetical protein
MRGYRYGPVANKALHRTAIPLRSIAAGELHRSAYSGAPMDQQQKQSILEEIDAASEQYPYEAVDVLWVALVKIANSFPGSNEHRRMLALVESMSSEAVW